MKRMQALSFLFVAALLASLPASADEWSKTYTITGKPDLRVETSDANIRVTTWDQHTIEAKVVTSGYKIGIGGGDIRIDEHQTGDTVELKVRYPHMGFNIGWNNRKVEIIIQMPREGRVDLSTGDGKIELSGLKGEMQLHSGDGSEILDAVDGRLRANTSDGRIRASGRFDDLDLKTGDGRVEVHASLGRRSAPAGDSKPATAMSASISPPILPPMSTCTPATATSISTCPSPPKAKFMKAELHGKLNGGGSLLTIRTGDGSIHLGKS